ALAAGRLRFVCAGRKKFDFQWSDPLINCVTSVKIQVLESGEIKTGGMDMKIGLLGCGAMGSLYGGYLSKVHEVYVCDVWKEHIEAIKANGIQLDEPEGNTAVFTPKLATTDPNE